MLRRSSITSRATERRQATQSTATPRPRVPAPSAGLLALADELEPLDPQDAPSTAAGRRHMGRVAAQGDMRPMAASREAMEDLKRILEGRSAFYSKADLAINTSGRSEDQAFAALRTSVRQHLTLPV